MPGIIHGRDEFTDLPEATSPTEKGGTEPRYGISQHRIIVEEEGEKVGVWGLAPVKIFRATPPKLQKTPFWSMVS